MAWQRIKNVVIPMISPTTFFLIVMIITLIQWRGQKKWVNY